MYVSGFVVCSFVFAYMLVAGSGGARVAQGGKQLWLLAGGGFMEGDLASGEMIVRSCQTLVLRCGVDQ